MVKLCLVLPFPACLAFSRFFSRAIFDFCAFPPPIFLSVWFDYTRRRKENTKDENTQTLIFQKEMGNNLADNVERRVIYIVPLAFSIMRTHNKFATYAPFTNHLPRYWLWMIRFLLYWALCLLAQLARS